MLNRNDASQPTKFIPIPNITKLEHDDSNNISILPPFQTRQEIKIKYWGICNNYRTQLLNIQPISAALGFHVEFLMRLLSGDFGAQIFIRPDHYSIMGRHSIEKLEKQFEKYIHDFVICHNCMKPTLDYNIITMNEQDQPVDDISSREDQVIKRNGFGFLMKCTECNCERLFEVKNPRSRLFMIINKYPPIRAINN